MDDHSLFGLQVETLFHLDSTGRLLSGNEPRAPPAARFYLGRMRHANRRHLRSQVLGTLECVEDNVAYICRGLGVATDDERIAAATEVMLEFTRAGLAPRPGAYEILAIPRAAGYKIGLISDCAPAVPRLWPRTPFASLVDAPIFSCAVHLRKPDPRIYHISCPWTNASNSASGRSRSTGSATGPAGFSPVAQ